MSHFAASGYRASSGAHQGQGQGVSREGKSAGVGSSTRAAAEKAHKARMMRSPAKVEGTGAEGSSPSPARLAHASLSSVPASSKASAAGGGSEGARLDRSGLKGTKGWAKKGGGGHGKFTWGKPGDETMEEPEVSKLDPNYDSTDENETNVIFDILEHHKDMARKAGISLDGYNGGGHLFGAPVAHSAGAGVASAPGVSAKASGKFAPVPLKLFKERCNDIVVEFLASEDIDELKQDLLNLHSPMLHYEFVRRAITRAMERTARERELVSLALSELYGQRVLPAEQVSKGFERLFEMGDDIALDVPKAKKYLSQFLARAVADEILPPSFLSDPLIEQLGGEVLHDAKVLLSIKHGLVRLDHVWGTTGNASVEELKEEIKMILSEFVQSSDILEACVCIKRLGVPHFMHEVVKRAVVLSLDLREREQAMMSSLLAELSSREIISQKQTELGFRRLYSELPDLKLDVPGAEHILDVFVHQAVKDRCLSVEAAVALKESIKSAQ